MPSGCSWPGPGGAKSQVTIKGWLVSKFQLQQLSSRTSLPAPGRFLRPCLSLLDLMINLRTRCDPTRSSNTGSSSLVFSSRCSVCLATYRHPGSCPVISTVMTSTQRNSEPSGDNNNNSTRY
ncbi:hypothetical protein N657DRAFT_370747 [Parathielavia appendiculata]|uniref:Uncharacterized protein n=1 Tax=Parathielavia appendiculata TaxID=2587402 RepID=A0AAN6TQ30_9PEZI|nr:hypothetical protein N657DRAFT_370747 [Parathielavia appendiculata]